MKFRNIVAWEILLRRADNQEWPPLQENRPGCLFQKKYDRKFARCAQIRNTSKLLQGSLLCKPLPRDRAGRISHPPTGTKGGTLITVASAPNSWDSVRNALVMSGLTSASLRIRTLSPFFNSQNSSRQLLTAFIISGRRNGLELSKPLLPDIVALKICLPQKVLGL